MRCLNFGLNLLKIFPAEVLGGLKSINSISDPSPDVRFIPSSEVNAEIPSKYLQSNKAYSIGGSWMAKRQMISEGNFDEILRLTKEAVSIEKQVRP